MPPPSRAYWKGYLRLALVTIPIQVHSATEPSQVALHNLHKPSGKRINYTVTAGGKEVEREDVVRGYPVAENTYITIEPEELDAIKLESKKTLDLKEFVQIEDIDPRYFESPYYIVPEDEFATEGYQVIKAALEKEKRLGLGQIIMGSGGREYLVAVGPVDRGLCMYVLRYADELRDAERYFADLPDGPAPAQLVDMAVQLIEENTSPFKAEAYRNSYEVALLDLVAQKSKGKKVVAKEEKEERPGTRNVVDLMDALRKSMKSDRATEKTEKTGEKKKARKSRA